MPGSIFVLHEDGALVEMRETSYDSEALLQRLLAEYPNLLAGDQIDPVAPRRWLLVTRELRVSGDEGVDRGSLDHGGSSLISRRRPRSRGTGDVIGPKRRY
jgi:hypothetical protein